MTPSEEHIIKTIINDAMGRGYVLSVYDGEEMPVHHSSDPEQVFNALGSTSEDHLRVYRVENGRYTWVGWVMFVYGNEPGVVVCDHTDNEATRDLLKTADALADQYCSGAL